VVSSTAGRVSEERVGKEVLNWLKKGQRIGEKRKNKDPQNPRLTVMSEGCYGKHNQVQFAEKRKY